MKQMHVPRMIGHFPYKSCMDVYGCALSSMVGTPGILSKTACFCVYISVAIGERENGKSWSKTTEKLS